MTTSFDSPLPILAVDATFDWQWPRPPLPCEVPAVHADGAEPCRIDTTNGVSVAGELVHFDAAARTLRFRTSRVGDALQLPFDKIRRLTLTTPWRIAAPLPGAPVERLPVAAQLRSFVATLAGGGSLIGHTQGRTEEEAGMFLFVPGDEAATLLRQFLPRSAYTSVEFGASAEERAEARWIGSRDALQAALAAQGSAPIRPLGDSLIELGLVTRDLLEQVMASQRGSGQDMPLGERLIYLGHIDRTDLQTALAHKMGYPIVNLARLRPDPDAARALPTAARLEFRAMPLFIEGSRLIVAVDDLASITRLQMQQSMAGRQLVPVLAQRGQLTIALTQAAQYGDLWADNVPTQF